MDQERTDFRQFDKRVDERTVPETQYEHPINTFPHGCVIGVSGTMPAQLNYDFLGVPRESSIVNGETCFIPTVWFDRPPTDNSGTYTPTTWRYTYGDVAVLPNTPQQLARVELRCGKLVLMVAGLILAVEGDKCRDGDFAQDCWDREMLGTAAERINAHVPYAWQGNKGLKIGGAVS